MASLKEMRNRIGSVKATQKITKAMQMVAAAKLRRAQDAAQSARPYAERMASVIANLAQGVSGESAPRLLAGTGADQRHVLVVATSDRGLAGGFNTSIVRAARERISSLRAAGKDVKLIIVGKKARDQLRRLHSDKIIDFYEAGGAPSMDVAQAVADRVTALFEAGEVDVVSMVYSRFQSVVSQVPSVKQLIPAEVAADAPQVDLKGAVYEYEPSEEAILETLLPRNLTIQLFSAMLENQAGFYAAQMTAMDNATRNAGDMIASLTLQYNRTRQAQITKELIEIISGAEAI
ncbi:F0F1 ATP synthase subunit gamma [Phenylobacterium sp.]|jgi:F-type H+-transporting ATPase subunit gamma|uniref:F0F1 ATP synthase subunit gamma n=1 Tax=Phenylobacterium sp. TaxID=1871053 RepID=UPI000C961984|nr:F0F1 ATP synthase subunit gamma [Phenylobacterium sp.]MAK81395.1 F0F1 ATP synthase subunit gamma [Phenylobacterium sp.]|tara:strand:+ start:33180 stop:34052 length:873 start_codon:yes stop_codon:yes gene_type:complete